MKGMKAKIWKALKIIALVTILSVVGGSAYTTIHFLRTSPRFEVKKVVVLGWRRETESQILTRADVPNKANVFSVDLDAIRERVEQMQWVRNAIVERVLPDTITVKVVEREPVGLAMLDGKIYQFDTEAAVLDYDPSSGVNFPILDGLQPHDKSGNLRRVDLYTRVLKELQGQTELSEVHINDADEVSVLLSGDPTEVSLGVGDFRARWLKYLELRPQIQAQYPSAVRVDFRFQGQYIVCVEADKCGPTDEKVVWDVAEKKSL
jgi:cell division septal protein FtsQ